MRFCYFSRFLQVCDNDDQDESDVEIEFEAKSEAKKALLQILWKEAACLYFASALNAVEQICCSCCQIWFVAHEMLICGWDESDFENNHTLGSGYDKKERIRGY